jgi:hypothetical protein
MRLGALNEDVGLLQYITMVIEAKTINVTVGTTTTVIETKLVLLPLLLRLLELAASDVTAMLKGDVITVTFMLNGDDALLFTGDVRSVAFMPEGVVLTQPGPTTCFFSATRMQHGYP